MPGLAQADQLAEDPTPGFKARLWLGAVLLAAGLFVLIDIALVTRISAFLIGGAAVVAGLATMFQRPAKRSWVGLLWRLGLGLLYVSFGLLLINQPVFQETFLRLALAAALVGSGILRIGLGLLREQHRWLLVSGFVGAAGAAAIFLQTPPAGIRFIATVLGIDLLVHGLVWLAGLVRVRSSAEP